MKSFYRIAGLIQMSFAAFVGLASLAMTISWLIAYHGTALCPKAAAPLGVSFFILCALALFCVGYVLWGIFFPYQTTQSLYTLLKFGPFVGPNPTLHPVDYPYVSTHPSYVGFDLMVILGAQLFAANAIPPQYAGCQFLESYWMGKIFFYTALALPILRLFAWYILKRKIVHEESTKKMWISLTVVGAIVGSITVWFIWGVYAPRYKLPKIIPQHSIKSNYLGQYVRVIGSPTSQQAIGCNCTLLKGCEAATALLTIDNSIQVIVHASSQEAAALLFRIANAQGKDIEIIGKLHDQPLSLLKGIHLPNCGLEKLPAPSAKVNRYFLEIEYP